MPDYERMYYYLFNHLSKVIEMLQNCQQACEQMYIGADNGEDDGRLE